MQARKLADGEPLTTLVGDYRRHFKPLNIPFNPLGSGVNEEFSVICLVAIDAMGKLGRPMGAIRIPAASHRQSTTIFTSPNMRSPASQRL